MRLLGCGVHQEGEFAFGEVTLVGGLPLRGDKIVLFIEHFRFFEIEFFVNEISFFSSGFVDFGVGKHVG
jgi:hypothetical protein